MRHAQKNPIPTEIMHIHELKLANAFAIFDQDHEYSTALGWENSYTTYNQLAYLLFKKRVKINTNLQLVKSISTISHFICKIHIIH